MADSVLSPSLSHFFWAHGEVSLPASLEAGTAVWLGWARNNEHHWQPWPPKPLTPPFSLLRLACWIWGEQRPSECLGTERGALDHCVEQSPTPSLHGLGGE